MYGGRHVCLLNDYNHVCGPYLDALLDQTLEQTKCVKRRLVLCTTRGDLQAGGGGGGGGQSGNNDWNDQDYDEGGPLLSVTSFLEELQSSWQLDDTRLLLMDDYNPMTLEKTLSQDNNNAHNSPSIIWVRGSNAFRTRHLLRTSGLDRYIQERCGSVSGPSLLFVGEGAGALVAGATLAVAHVQGHDPRAAPELQVNGLGLMGHDLSVSFGVHKEVLETSDRTEDLMSQEKIEVCTSNQIFVWSQQASESSDDNSIPISPTRFVMTPNQRGVIERFTQPDPLPPLVDKSVDTEGVPCMGEPAIDPSRFMQRIGDSEWMEEANSDVLFYCRNGKKLT